MRSCRCVTPVHLLITLGVLILLPCLSAASTQFYCLLPVESPVFGSQTFECELPGDIATIVDVRVGIAGEFAGTLWICGLETPDPFGGPGGLTLAVSATADDESPTSFKDWVASIGTFDEDLLMVAPEASGWGTLVEDGRVKLVIEDYIPPAFDCMEHCQHNDCMNVSGFGELTMLQLIVDYEAGVANGQVSWGMIKARW